MAARCQRNQAAQHLAPAAPATRARPHARCAVQPAAAARRSARTATCNAGSPAATTAAAGRVARLSLLLLLLLLGALLLPGPRRPVEELAGIGLQVRGAGEVVMGSREQCLENCWRLPLAAAMQEAQLQWRQAAPAQMWRSRATLLQCHQYREQS